MAFENNYTLGRGRLLFNRKMADGTYIGFRYLGNTPEFNLNFESEKLEHYSSDRGIRELDKSVILQITRSGSLTTDNVSPENVALFFFGSSEGLTVAQSTVTAEVLQSGVGVEQGMHYQLGATTNNPSGARGIIFPGEAGSPDTTFVVEPNGGGTAYVSGTDYLLDPATGLLEILEGGAISDGDEPQVTYTVSASTRSRIISGSSPVEGQLKFIADNPTGENIDYFLPDVALSPNGDYALKGDEWQQIPFNVDVLKPSTSEALYADGRAVTA